MESTKACLVSGGAGFIGSYLCDILLKQGNRVISLDNFITGQERNIEQARKNSAFRFIKHDVCVPLDINEKVDYVYHLASPASVPDYQAHPLETARVNSIGTENLLSLAKHHNARFLYASTSEVYGDPREHPQKESYWGNVNPSGPRSCYDESKRFGEMVTMVYYRQFNLDVRITRTFNTYGPRMRRDDGRVVSNFINQALSGKPITVYGNGSQTRSLCYVDDMVLGIKSMMESEKAKGETVNLGNPAEYKVIDLADKIKRMTNSNSKIVHGVLPVDDPKVRRPDISKAKNLLGWEPVISVDDGLKKTIEYYKSV